MRVSKRGKKKRQRGGEKHSNDFGDEERKPDLSSQPVERGKRPVSYHQ